MHVEYSQNPAEMASMGSREHVLLAQKTRLRIELIVKGHLRVGTLWSLLWADRGAICSRRTPCIDSKRRSFTGLILVNTLEELTQLYWKRCFAKNINKLPMVYWSSTAFALLVVVTHTLSSTDKYRCAYDSEMASPSMNRLTNASCLLYFIQDEPKEAACTQSMWPLTPQGADAVYKELTGRGFYTGLMVSFFGIIIHQPRWLLWIKKDVIISLKAGSFGAIDCHCPCSSCPGKLINLILAD